MAVVSTLDIAWAAGFIEGEGCFGAPVNVRTGVSVSAAQVQREPLERLQRIFGGRIRFKKARPPRQNHYVWWLPSLRSAEVTMTLFCLLSPRRKEQAAKLIAAWKAQRGHKNLQKTHCPQGHAYTPENVYLVGHKGLWRVCRICHKKRVYARVRAKRVAKRTLAITNT